MGTKSYKNALKVIVAGNKLLDNYDVVRQKLDYYFSRYKKGPIIIVSQKILGPSFFAEKYATINGYKIKHFVANCDVLGKAANSVRDKRMLKYANAIVVFHNNDEYSLTLLEKAKQHNLLIRQVQVQDHHLWQM